MRTPNLQTDHAPAGSTEVQILPAPKWVDGHPTLHEITDDIVGAMEARPGRGWVPTPSGLPAPWSSAAWRFPFQFPLAGWR